MAEPIDWNCIRAVYFDAVGTVLFPSQSAPNIYCEAAKRYGLDLSPDQVKQRFTEAYLRQEALDEQTNWFTDEGREVLRWQAIVTESLPGAPPECFDWLYQHFAKPEAWRVPPEAVQLFEELHSCGLQLGLASNYDLRLQSVLAGRPELNLLAANVVISSVIGVRKPGAIFFAKVVELARCSPHEILFIGDDLQNDFLGARSAGFRAILLDEHNRYPTIVDRVHTLSTIQKQLAERFSGQQV
jgi:putative hydrolase of the HAD superfamily